MDNVSSKIGIIIASRFSSKRLPGKALLPIGEHSILGFLLLRLRGCRAKNKIIVATSTEGDDDSIYNEAKKYQANVFRGSLNDVADRYFRAARGFGVDTIVRLTGDNPFLDSEYVKFLLKQCQFPISKFYTTRPSCPKGLNIDIFSTVMLDELCSQKTLSPEHKENVTSWFLTAKSKFPVVRLKLPNVVSQSEKSFSIDTQEDYEMAIQRLQSFKDSNFSTDEFVKSAQ